MLVTYSIPELQLLLSVSSFLYLLPVAEWIVNRLLNAGLIGSLALGVIYGPQVTDILQDNIQECFIILGYIGLLLLVFEAGLSTNLPLLLSNLFISTLAALTGITLPIVFSIMLLHLGFGFTALQAFGAGAALCSTSLGTTLALLRPDLRQTRTGSVLLSAALIDDVAGLVMSALIPKLVPDEEGSSGITWKIILRPILVSLSFGVLVPTIAVILSRVISKFPTRVKCQIYRPQTQLFIIIAALFGFVAAARYAGASELFASYLCGILLSATLRNVSDSANTPPSPLSFSTRGYPIFGPQETFSNYFSHPLRMFLSPLFFGSIGTALPIRSLISANGSHQVIWKGIVYGLFMALAKLVVGLWVFVCPEQQTIHGDKEISSVSNAEDKGNQATGSGIGEHPSTLPEDTLNHPAQLGQPPKACSLSRLRSAALLGTAMVARGEIALIIAELAKPLLFHGNTIGKGKELFSIIIWAILITTVGGAVGVGFLLRIC